MIFQIKTKSTRGGSRPNSGRPKKSYRTVTVAFRVREEWADKVKEAVKRTVKRLGKVTLLFF